MPNMPETPERIAHAFVTAINNHDTRELSALMPPEHRFIDSLGGVTVGRQRMQEAWTSYFDIFPDYHIRVEETLTDGFVVVMLGAAHGTYVKQGLLSVQNSWSMPAVWRAQIQDGKVIEWRVYADNEPVRQVIAKV